ncbi:hypothetical protein [Pedobacter sp. Hv1]|uniref:hypothetical protein n=1 Tax=Pedobacter sp. Hv1 TaxID=1740090 RepID=UPI0006D894D9|nr:hypothetical protein [Pedobacter sp. Hv1]KQB99357.1 hypothetical protein AQF98_17445 [Pedobacter sp. Hv1]
MKRYLFLCLACLTILSCEKTPEVIDPPTKAVLSLPNNNEACISGTIISPTLSSILFKWTASQNADSYEITVKNLESGVTTSQTTANIELPITLTRNTPYSWFVTAKSSKTSTTAKSEVWKFFNAGDALSFYSPFPAEMISPTMGQRITPNAGKTTLQWTGSDADNDIVNYDIYLGTTNTPTLLKSNQVGLTLADVAINTGTTYYWKVITRDSKGNTSDSGVYIFYTN